MIYWKDLTLKVHKSNIGYFSGFQYRFKADLTFQFIQIIQQNMLTIVGKIA